jgi:hypothetical protein
MVGSGTLAPGASPGTITVAGNLGLSPASVLSIELGGLGQGIGYDYVLVQGTANLGGTLNVGTIGGYVPPAGSSYTFMQFTSSVGAFSAVNLPAGLEFSSLAAALNLQVPVVTLPQQPGASFDPVTVAIERIVSMQEQVAQWNAIVQPDEAELPQEIELEGCR